MESAQAAGRGVKRMRNSAGLAAPGESVVREFLQKNSRVLSGAYKKEGNRTKLLLSAPGKILQPAIDQ
jgi:hypothetical protein